MPIIKNTKRHEFSESSWNWDFTDVDGSDAEKLATREFAWCVWNAAGQHGTQEWAQVKLDKKYLLYKMKANHWGLSDYPEENLPAKLQIKYSLNGRDWKNIAKTKVNHSIEYCLMRSEIFLYEFFMLLHIGNAKFI